MKYERALIFAAGVAAGVGAYALVQSGAAKKAAVAVVSKGMCLRDKVAAAAERMKESAEDIVAEASYVNEQAKAGEPAAEA